MPNVASRNTTSSNLKTPTYCSTSSGKFNVSSPSSYTKLSKILKNWPYLRLKEAANAAKDGELGAACRIEMERRKQNYKN